MSIKEIPNTAVTVRMTCLNPECKQFFSDKVVNFDYDKRQYGKPRERCELVENVKINKVGGIIETYIVCDKCGQPYKVEISKV